MAEDVFISATFEKRTCMKCGATVVALKNEKDPVCQNCGRGGKEAH